MTNVNDSDAPATVPVSFRINSHLARRLRAYCDTDSWPPPPSMTEIAERGIEIVLDNLERKRKRGKRSVAI